MSVEDATGFEFCEGMGGCKGRRLAGRLANQTREMSQVKVKDSVLDVSVEDIPSDSEQDLKCEWAYGVFRVVFTPGAGEYCGVVLPGNDAPRADVDACVGVETLSPPWMGLVVAPLTQG